MSDLDKIKKMLDNHEKRISKLEKLLSENKSKKIRTNKSKTSIMDLIIEIKNEGFFNKPRSRKDIVQKFEELGHIYDGGSLNFALLKSVKTRKLGRKKIAGKWGYVKR